jgi:hypothetical protein
MPGPRQAQGIGGGNRLASRAGLARLIVIPDTALPRALARCFR